MSPPSLGRERQHRARGRRLADRSRRPIAIRPELLNSGAATHRAPKTPAALVPLCAASIGPGRVRTHSLRPVRGDLSSWWRNPAPPSAGLFLGEFPGCLAGTGPIAVPRLIGRGPSHPDHLSPAAAPALEKLPTPQDVRVLECHVPIGCELRDELGTDFHAEVVGWKFSSRQSCIQTLVAMIAYSTASDRLFQQHPTGCSTGIRPVGGGGLRQGSSSLIAPLAVKGVGGAEGCPREGPARPAPRPPRGWRCRARGRDLWATRGGIARHRAVPVAVSRSPAAPVLRRDGPSRAMR